MGNISHVVFINTNSGLGKPFINSFSVGTLADAMAECIPWAEQLFMKIVKQEKGEQGCMTQGWHAMATMWVVLIS